MNFWQSLPKPIIGLSPMDGISDAPFRYISAKYGKPDVTITEFISVDGIAHGAERLFMDFLYHNEERPVVAQVFGNDPELFYQAAWVIAELGFDGMDLNMGCPAKTVAARGAGAGLIKHPELARELIKSAKQGLKDWSEDKKIDLPAKLQDAIDFTKNELDRLGTKINTERKLLPLSVKTRIGYSEVVVEEWIENLLQERPANLTVHGRTLKQLYTGQADWGAITRAAKIVAEFNKTAPAKDQVTILGNGDLLNREMIDERIELSGVDGVLVGRAVMGNPWVFGNTEAPDDLKARLAVALEHAKLHVEMKGMRSFVQMRKHFGAYIKNFHGASAIRVKLMQANNVEEIEAIFAQIPDSQ